MVRSTGMRGMRIAAAVSLLLAVPSIAFAQAQNLQQQTCTNALNRCGIKLARAVVGELGRCMAAASANTLPEGQTADDCFAADARGRLAKIRAKTAKAAANKCFEPPSFGPTSADDVIDGFAPLLAANKLFGSSLDAAAMDATSDKSGADCQKAIIKAAERTLVARIAAYNDCARRGLASGFIDSAQMLSTCIGDDSQGAVAAADARAQELLDAKCPNTDLSVATECGAVALGDAVSECVAVSVACDACRNLNAAGHITANCDPYVDGLANPRCSDVPAPNGWSAARYWDEQLLASIRRDLPRPPVHARNLFHTSIAMYDAWAAYEDTVTPYLVDESPVSSNVEADRDIAISFAAYRVIRHRFANAINKAVILPMLDAAFAALGYDKDYTTTEGDGAPAVGNRIAAAVIAYGLTDGSNEAGNYADPSYLPLNDPLVVKLPGTEMDAPNHWQPLALDFFVSQNGIPEPISVQTYVGSGWSPVLGFALTGSPPYHDPGPPPQITPPSCDGPTDAQFKQSAVEVIRLSNWLDPSQNEIIDISPGAIYNNSLGANDGTGYPENPCTGQPYAPNPTNRADFGRVIAEFWADGPTSETPPGHWNVIANYVSDHPSVEKRIGGAGEIVDDLEWDVKLYFALNAAVHDAAITSWSIKRTYDYVRPISMIRYMGGLGQSTDPEGPSYDPCGLPLEDGLIEVITAATTAPGQRHAHLAGKEGKIAIKAWPGEPANPATDVSGAKWVLAESFVPYQRKTFVTPPFAAYTSGHSTFSRAAAELMSAFTGSTYYPGCLGEYVMRQGEFLTFEEGPTADVHLQWARYYDSADEAARSRLWGGIHVQADDFNGRITGSQVGLDTWALAQQYFAGAVNP